MERDGFGMRQTPEAEPDAPEGELAPAAEAPPETEIMTDAPSTDGPMETTSAPGTDAPTSPEPEAAPEASAEPAAETKPIAFGTQETKVRALLDGDYTEADLARDIESGRVSTGKRGQLVRSSVSDIRTIKEIAQGGRDIQKALGPKELTPDEKLEGVLAQVDLGNEAFRDNPLELLDAIRAQANASGLTDAEADELAKLYSSRNGLDAAGNAPEISMELRGRALAEVLTGAV
jgi:hypothetical protein